MGVIRFVSTVLLLAAAGSTLVLAQNRQRPPEPGATTVGELPGSQPTFRAGVTLVTTDVIVREENGVFVPGLDRNDFRVFEDGIEQEIATLVQVLGGRVYNLLTPPAPVREGIIPADGAAGQRHRRPYLHPLRRRPPSDHLAHAQGPAGGAKDCGEPDSRGRSVRDYLYRSVVAVDRHDLRPPGAHRRD